MTARRAQFVASDRMVYADLGSVWWFGPDLAWQRQAVCGTEGRNAPDQFFPGGGRPSTRSTRMCKGCPVREQCLDWALVNEEQGIWGGLTEAERRKLLASRLPLGTETK